MHQNEEVMILNQSDIELDEFMEDISHIFFMSAVLTKVHDADLVNLCIERKDAEGNSTLEVIMSDLQYGTYQQKAFVHCLLNILGRIAVFVSLGGSSRMIYDIAVEMMSRIPLMKPKYEIVDFVDESNPTVVLKHDAKPGYFIVSPGDEGFTDYFDNLESLKEFITTEGIDDDSTDKNSGEFDRAS